MRVLNKKQKKLLDEWFETIKNESGLAVIDVVEDLLPYDLWIKLQSINDFETIYDHINIYINDKA